MSYALQKTLAALLPVSGFALCFGMAAAAGAPRNLPVDRPVQVNGIDAACTGIGNREQNESRWSKFPVKLETVGGYGQWLGDQNVTVEGRGHIVRLHCDGPWLVMGLQPGRYEAVVSIPDAQPRHVRFTAPARGQRDVIVRFAGRMGGKEKTGEM